MSLKEPNLKMSKSHTDPRSRILINDSSEDIAMKIRLAVTDSLPGITYQPKERHGISNLVALLNYFDEQGRSSEELADLHHDASMRAFKDRVVEVIDRALASIRERYNHLVDDAQGDYLEDVARKGALSARDMAGSTMATVRQAVGLS